MILLSLDPSSNCTGYAVCDELRWIEAGKLKGKSTDDAILRIDAMCTELTSLLEQHQPGSIIIETPAPQKGARQRSNPRGQAVYGMAVGHIRCQCLRWLAAQPGMHSVDVFEWVETVRADEWTNGTSKQHRQRWAAQSVPGYDAAKDKGGDVADACALARWWWQQQRLMR